eukprot:4279391-Alexandrium_andersonii.AAC.1
MSPMCPFLPWALPEGGGGHKQQVAKVCLPALGLGRGRGGRDYLGGHGVVTVWSQINDFYCSFAASGFALGLTWGVTSWSRRGHAL